jgi:hypothetical protein
MFGFYMNGWTDFIYIQYLRFICHKSVSDKYCDRFAESSAR